MTDRPAFPSTPVTQLDNVDIWVRTPAFISIDNKSPVLMRFGDYEVSISPQIARNLSAGLVYAAARSEQMQAAEAHKKPSA